MKNNQIAVAAKLHSAILKTLFEAKTPLNVYDVYDKPEVSSTGVTKDRVSMMLSDLYRGKGDRLTRTESVVKGSNVKYAYSLTPAYRAILEPMFGIKKDVEVVIPEREPKLPKAPRKVKLEAEGGQEIPDIKITADSVVIKTSKMKVTIEF